MATTFKLFAEKMGGSVTTSYVGNTGEIFYDPSTGSLRLSDGSTAGGIAIGGGGGTTQTLSLVGSTLSVSDGNSVDLSSAFTEADTLATVTARGATTTTQITTAGIVTTANSTIGGHLIPDANEQYDLGSATNKFRDLYLSSATIKMGAEENTVGFIGTDFQVNGEPVNTIVSNTTVVQNIQNGTGWSLPGPYQNEADAIANGVTYLKPWIGTGGGVSVVMDPGAV